MLLQKTFGKLLDLKLRLLNFTAPIAISRGAQLCGILPRHIASLPRPPIAPSRPHECSAHGVVWNDPYHCLRNPGDPAVMAYLVAENEYSAKALGRRGGREKSKLIREMTGRMAATESTPPERWGEWVYYSRVPPGKEYPLFCRRPAAEGTGEEVEEVEEVVLDQNELAELHGYAHVGMLKLSPDHSKVAFTLDTTGKEQFRLVVKDLNAAQGGRTLHRFHTQGVVSVEWGGDGSTLFYTLADVHQRPYRHGTGDTNVRFRIMRKDAAGDHLLLSSDDPSCFADVARTKDWRYITLNLNTKTSSEVWVVDGSQPRGAPVVVEPRCPGVEYFVEHNRGCLYILSNGGEGGEYRLYRTPSHTPGRAHWEVQEVLPPRPDSVVVDLDMFAEYAVLYERHKGRPRATILPIPDATCVLPVASEELRDVALPPLIGGSRMGEINAGANQEFSASSVRMAVSSAILPEATFDCHLASGQVTLLHQQPVVLPAYCPQTPLMDLSPLYSQEEHEALSWDGAVVPLTILRARGEAAGKVLLHSYGAYGQSLAVEWDSNRLSLLDRGWTLAFAHVRGGGELGKAWHRGGKLEYKLNSFHDLIACAELLIERGECEGGGWDGGGTLAGKGGSAGGLLFGAVANMRPDLFRALILQVPFLDILNTMMDASLPLTSHEYEEWGNPEVDSEVFHRLRAYSPYDNLRRGGGTYPAMLLSASLQDTRVGYWEAAKFAAKLRALDSCNSAPLFLCTSMDTGHFGEGGRYQHLDAVAREYSFLLNHV